jgi:hypothetical protein
MKTPTRAQRIVYQVLEALDPDDPELFLKTQPGFQFRMTQFEGEQVFVSGTGEGETESDWPWPIGNVVEGPVNRWYVVDIHRIAQERLGEYGLGLDGRTFDTKGEAAIAIWTVWSRLPKREVMDRKRRRVREAHAGFDAEYLNSNQPLPKDMAVVYNTLHQPWAEMFARRMRDKYGINAWVDGTVNRGWKIVVHAADADRAKRMFASIA